MDYVISKDKTRIAYDKSGRGPVLIIVLGALNTRKSGAKLAKLLAKNFTVISYDRRGRGNSGDTLPYAPEREVDDLTALVDSIGKPVFIYGHSSGAALALLAVRKLGKKIKKLAIYEAPYTVSPADRAAAKRYDAQLFKLIRAGRIDDAVGLFIRAVGVSDKQLQALKRLPMWRGLVKLAPTLVYDSKVLGQSHAVPTALLKRMTTPTLVLHGGKGSPMMAEAAQAIRRALPKAQLKTLTGQTHGVSPVALAPILKKFFLGK